jgi:hypothetical protein
VAIRAAFAESFGEPLSQEDWEAFLDLAECRGLLDDADRAAFAEPGARRRQTRRPSRTSKIDVPEPASRYTKGGPSRSRPHGWRRRTIEDALGS